MKLPWNTDKEERIEQLEEKIKNLEEEKDKLENQYEEEKLNRLQDKVQGLKGEKNEEKDESKKEVKNISYRKAYGLLNKLSTIKDEKKELVTVQCPGKFGGFDRRKDLKNSIDKNQFSELSGRKSFTAFMDEDLGNWIIESRPFFREKMSISQSFEASEFLEFMEKEKIWVLLSAGDTKVFRESSGDFEQLEHLKARIEEKHSKGGFSQGRFERKRDEQINQYLGEVKEYVKGLEGEVFLLGEQRFCAKAKRKRSGISTRN